MSQTLIVIPARLASTRLPRKLLLCETGRPLIQHTYEAATRSRRVDRVVVATEDLEIAAVVRDFGGEVVMTGPQPTGTDRVAEAARQLPGFECVVNVQGDEPEINPHDIDLAIEALIDDAEAVVSTLAVPLRDSDRLSDPACVKVVCDQAGHALYFSRSPIPFARDASRDWLGTNPPIYHQHIGLYAYRADFLKRFAELPATDLEVCESLEQLRILQSGFKIRVCFVSSATKGIDTPADYRAFVSRHTN